jgi:hypothetical protein
LDRSLGWFSCGKGSWYDFPQKADFLDLAKNFPIPPGKFGLISFEPADRNQAILFILAARGVPEVSFLCLRTFSPSGLALAGGRGRRGATGWLTFFDNAKINPGSPVSL